MLLPSLPSPCRPLLAAVWAVRAVGPTARSGATGFPVEDQVAVVDFFERELDELSPFGLNDDALFGRKTVQRADDHVLAVPRLLELQLGRLPREAFVIAQ